MTIGNLIDGFAICPAPISPLSAVDPAEIAIFIRPFVPDRNAVFIEIADVRIAPQEPKQFVDDGLEMELLCGEHRKAFPYVDSSLRAEDRKRSGAGAIVALFPVIENKTEQFVILTHLTTVTFVQREATEKTY